MRIKTAIASLLMLLSDTNKHQENQRVGGGRIFPVEKDPEQLCC
jgi:hypothetical protein